MAKQKVERNSLESLCSKFLDRGITTGFQITCCRRVMYGAVSIMRPQTVCYDSTQTKICNQISKELGWGDVDGNMKRLTLDEINLIADAYRDLGWEVQDTRDLGINVPGGDWIWLRTHCACEDIPAKVKELVAMLQEKKELTTT